MGKVVVVGGRVLGINEAREIDSESIKKEIAERENGVRRQS